MDHKFRFLGFLIVFFCSFCFINISDVKAGGTIEGGNGKGYAQCGYVWTDNVPNTSTTAYYRLIVRVWGSNSDGKNWINWNHNFVEAGVSPEGSQTGSNYDDRDSDNTVGQSTNDIINSVYRGSNNFECPSNACVKREGILVYSYRWQLSDGSCPDGYDSIGLSNYSDWTSSNNTASTNGDINVTPLYKYASKDSGADENSFQGETAENNSEDITDIEQWGQSATNSLYANNTVDACAIVDEDLKDLLQTILTWISIAGIVILLIMSILEFVKAITGSDDSGIKTAFKHTLIRIACVVVLLLLPMLVTGIIDAVNNNNVYREEDGSYKIGDNGEPLCRIDK